MLQELSSIADGRPWPQQTWAEKRGGLRWTEVYFRTKWRLHPSSRLATIDIGRKLGGRAATPSTTTSPGPRFTSVPSGILVHPAVWPQRTLAENWGLCPFRGRERPHLTQCCLGDDYRIQLVGRTKTFHANMLQKYWSRKHEDRALVSHAMVFEP